MYQHIMSLMALYKQYPQLLFILFILSAIIFFKTNICLPNPRLQSKYILSYDVDCAPYTRLRNLVDILVKYEKIDFMSLTEADQKGLLDVNPVPSTLHAISFHFPN